MGSNPFLTDTSATLISVMGALVRTGNGEDIEATA